MQRKGALDLESEDPSVTPVLTSSYLPGVGGVSASPTRVLIYDI